jgi:hypothetical protein
MGVPVVTLAGDRHAARVGASLLGAIGFAAGITTSARDYVATARLLAGHPALLATARRSLRADLVRSPLCDKRGHAAALQATYRAVWQLRCAAARACHAPGPAARRPRSAIAMPAACSPRPASGPARRRAGGSSIVVR